MINKYNSDQYKSWYKLNRDRIKDAKRVSKKKYRRTEAGKAAQRRYNAKPSRKLYVKNYRLNKEYGITIQEYSRLLLDQENKCAICKRTSVSKLHVDHDHVTKKVRGLLCGSCNRGIGLFGDSTELLGDAIDYLNRTCSS